jgi:inner membrane protein
MRKALIIKLLLLAAVTVGLTVVLARIGWIVDERQGYQREAVQSVTESQAGAQTLLGPMLLRNCTEQWQVTTVTDKEKKVSTETSSYQMVSTPATLDVSGALNAEARYRGLFKVNGYAGPLKIKANWADLSALRPSPSHQGGQVTCDDLRVMLAMSDVRGVRAATLTMGKTPLAMKAGTTHENYVKGMHADLPRIDPSQPLELTLDLELNGTQDFAVVPAAAATSVNVHSNWPHPSFTGRFLTASREVTDAGFDAHWKVSELASPAAHDVLELGDVPGIGGKTVVKVDTLGFSMIDPVNPYVMSDRAIKYGLMFIVLTFVCVGLVELMAGARVHPVQYLLVGLAQALFFLLLLSLSEQLAFAVAYGIAAGATAALLAYYGAAALGSIKRGLLFGMGVAAIYGALYVLLTLEQASLLVGSLLLFAVLAAVMVATRRIDWHKLVPGS